MTGEQDFRRRVLWAAVHLIGTPYWWGGNDPAKDPGVDCSGFVLHCWRVAGLNLADTTAQGLRMRLDATTTPQPGDVAFYGSEERATHVVLVLAPEGKAIVGANGGTSFRRGESHKAYQERMGRIHASVRVEDHRKHGSGYRGDFLSFGRVPWEGAGT